MALKSTLLFYNEELSTLWRCFIFPLFFSCILQHLIVVLGGQKSSGRGVKKEAEGGKSEDQGCAQASLVWRNEHAQGQKDHHDEAAGCGG